MLPSAKSSSRALLQRVTIRDNSGDHEGLLKVGRFFTVAKHTEAISEYARLTPIVNKTPDSAYSKIFRNLANLLLH